MRWVARLFAGFLLVLLAGFGIFWLMADKDMRRLIAHFPTDRDLLFWSQEQRDATFRSLDRLPFLVSARTIKAGGTVRPLLAGPPIKLATDVNDYMRAQHTSGLVVLHKGQIRLEKYGLDFDANGKWTSFSVAKSMTSTMVGAAIKDGFIKSIDDKVTVYIPDLRGSAYDDVTIAQLLTMTSGVRWNEDYADPNSDVAKFNNHVAEPGVDVTVSYMRTLTREAPAGTKWVYKTGETNLIGVLVSSATGRSLAEYLSAKVWKPYGMERDATWLLGASEHEISGCCVQAATRDFARFGQFILDGGVVNGQSILPGDWLAAATRKRADIGEPGHGYGYQWWTNDDGSFAAQGIFGQGIFIDPARQLVIASNGDWPKATGQAVGAQREEFYRTVQNAIDAERAAVR